MARAAWCRGRAPGVDIVGRRLREAAKLIPAFRFIPRGEVSKHLESMGASLDGRACFKCGRPLTAGTVGAIFSGACVDAVCAECLERHGVFALYKEFAERSEGPRPGF